MSSLFLFRFIAFSGFLYLLYLLIFRRFSFHATNRWLLLSFPLISIAIPLIAPYFVSPLASTLPLVNLPEIILEGTNSAESTALVSLNWYSIVYLSVAAASLLMIGIGLIKAFGIKKRAHNATGNVYYSDHTQSAYTLFGSVIIPLSMKNHKDISTIIRHEQVHVRQWHGLDNLYYQLLTALAWFNPFIHLLAKELRQTHECLADEEALQKTSREEYAHLLLSSAFGNELKFPLAAGTATPFFSSSLIKTRITMIYKTKTNRHFKWVYLAILPVIAMMTLYSCDKVQEAKTVTSQHEEKTSPLSFVDVEQVPLFDGCDANMSKEESKACFQQNLMQYVGNNFKYPQKAHDLQLEGKVFVQFVVDKDASIKDVEVVRGLTAEEGNSEQQDAVDEAHREISELIASLPFTTPAYKDGKKVEMSFVIPINLKLQ